MRRLALVAALSLPVSTRAQTQEEEPSRGTALIIVGGILTGVGALNLATASLCSGLYEDQQQQDLCFTSSLVIGGGMVAVGIPMLIVGLSRRSTHREWEERNQALAGLRLIAGPRGGAVGWSAEF